MAARTAVDAQLALSRQRSPAAPMGIKAAMPTANIWNTDESEAADPSGGNPRKKNGSAAIQFQTLPAMARECAGLPGYPIQAQPITAYTIAATENANSDDVIEWAALRDRLSPVFTSEIPAAARGIRRMKIN